MDLCIVEKGILQVSKNILNRVLLEYFVVYWNILLYTGSIVSIKRFAVLKWFIILVIAVLFGNGVLHLFTILGVNIWLARFIGVCVAGLVGYVLHKYKVK